MRGDGGPPQGGSKEQGGIDDRIKRDLGGKVSRTCRVLGSYGVRERSGAGKSDYCDRDAGTGGLKIPQSQNPHLSFYGWQN